jgi:hypothetical protein
LAVYWVVQQIRKDMSAEQFARAYDVPASRVNSALAYAEAFADEIQRDMEAAESNGRWVELQDSAWRTGHPGRKTSKAGAAKPK